MAGTSSAFFPFLLLLPSALLRAQERDAWVEIKGRVVDVRGKPVADVRLAKNWNFDGGKATAFGEVLEWKQLEGNRRQAGKTQDLRTDAEGRFEGRLECWMEKHALLAITDDLQQAGYVEVSKKEKNDALAITLAPTVRVRGSFACKDLGRKPTWTNVYMTALPGKHRFVSCSSREAMFDLRLPPGKYELYGYGSDVKGMRREIVLEAENPDLDLGEIDLRGEYLALMQGKELPEWKVTAARGVPLEKSTIASFRGKWLLVEFWGYW